MLSPFNHTVIVSTEQKAYDLLEQKELSNMKKQKGYVYSEEAKKEELKRESEIAMLRLLTIRFYN